MNKTDKVCIGIGIIALLFGGTVLYNSRYKENECAQEKSNEEIQWDIFKATIPETKISFTEKDQNWYCGNSRFNL